MTFFDECDLTCVAIVQINEEEMRKQLIRKRLVVSCMYKPPANRSLGKIAVKEYQS